MSDNVTSMCQLGLSLRYAYTPRTSSEQQAIADQHPCAACGARKNYVVGDSGPLRRHDDIAYYRVALKCRCGFMNFAYVIVNDLPGESGSQALPDTDSALRDAVAAGTLSDPFVEELLVRTSVAGFKQEWDDAMRLALQSVKCSPDHPAAWFNLGWLYVNAGDFQAGLDSYRRTTQLTDDFPSAWLNMGNVYRHLERFDEAIACLDRFIERFPNHAEAKQRRQQCLERINGNYHEREGEAVITLER